MIKKFSKKIYKITLILGILILLGIINLDISSAVSGGTGIVPIINTEKFQPRVWMCDSRVVLDDAVEPGRISNDGQMLIERINNYAFEGEQISWQILVFDANGISTVKDTYVTLGDSQGYGNNIESNCILDEKISPQTEIPESCNARLSEYEINSFVSGTAAFYTCTYTVETPESAYGEYWVTVEAQDSDNLFGTMAENEYWFFNPVVSVETEGEISFDNVKPGTSALSKTLLVRNDADQGSGVMLDMFITGTDFYDSSSSGARCPTTNQLSLNNFRYFATKGAYSTKNDLGVGRGSRVKDSKGYIGIGYGIGFNNPNLFYDGYEIIQAQKTGPYYLANILFPGSEIAVTFKLDLPEPCAGNFDSGRIFFWGEAI